LDCGGGEPKNQGITGADERDLPKGVLPRALLNGRRLFERGFIRKASVLRPKIQKSETGGKRFLRMQLKVSKGEGKNQTSVRSKKMEERHEERKGGPSFPT